MITDIHSSETLLWTAKGHLQQTGGHEKIKPLHGNGASIVMQRKAKPILFRAGVSILNQHTLSPSRLMVLSSAGPDR